MFGTSTLGTSYGQPVVGGYGAGAVGGYGGVLGGYGGRTGSISPPMTTTLAAAPVAYAAPTVSTIAAAPMAYAQPAVAPRAFTQTAAVSTSRPTTSAQSNTMGTFTGYAADTSVLDDLARRSKNELSCNRGAGAWSPANGVVGSCNLAVTGQVMTTPVVSAPMPYNAPVAYSAAPAVMSAPMGNYGAMPTVMPGAMPTNYGAMPTNYGAMPTNYGAMPTVMSGAVGTTYGAVGGFGGGLLGTSTFPSTSVL